MSNFSADNLRALLVIDHLTILDREQGKYIKHKFALSFNAFVKFLTKESNIAWYVSKYKIRLDRYPAEMKLYASSQMAEIRRIIDVKKNPPMSKPPRQPWSDDNVIVFLHQQLLTAAERIDLYNTYSISYSNDMISLVSFEESLEILSWAIDHNQAEKIRSDATFIMTILRNLVKTNLDYNLNLLRSNERYQQIAKKLESVNLNLCDFTTTPL